MTAASAFRRIRFLTVAVRCFPTRHTEGSRYGGEAISFMKSSFICTDKIKGEWEGIGHCALGYADCEQPAAPPRKENRAYYIK